MKKYFLLAFAVSQHWIVSAQNNNIFYGGSGDGWSKVSYSQLSNNTLSRGGAGDGWGRASYLQFGSNQLFLGGGGDGWSRQSYLQSGGTQQFNGGSGDGWNHKTYSQSGGAQQFLGGNGDGWVKDNYSQSYANAAFKGGAGDGWASTYTPLVPLPMSFLRFEAIKQQNSSKLTWEMSNEDNIVRYEIQRSDKAVYFETIGSILQKDELNKSYIYFDEQPLSGHNYYRIKVWSKDGTYDFTNTKLVIFDDSRSTVLKVYPNPTTDQLFAELPAEFHGQPVAVNVYDANGRIVYHEKHTEQTKKIHFSVSTLAAGSYLLHVATNRQTAIAKFSVKK